jgi:hypothetical protein
MQFEKITFDGKQVELHYREPLEAGGEETKCAHGKNPSPAFKAALQSFTSYVLWVHSWPAEMGERLEIRGVSIKRPDDAPRGIVVTALLKCPHARNSTSTINSPYVAEPPQGYNGEMTGLLSIAVRELIDALEERATDFRDGERGEQIPLALGESENTKAFADRSAAAEGTSTRKPKKAKGFIPGVGMVVNADAPIEDITDDMVRQLLMMVERDVPVDAITSWASSERTSAIAWARMEQRRLAGALKPAELAAMPKEPNVIKASATMPLLPTKPALSIDRTVQ